jgi:hypothetical protein
MAGYTQFETRQFFDGRVAGTAGSVFVHEGATTAVLTFFDDSAPGSLAAQNALGSVEVKTNARFVLAPANGSAQNYGVQDGGLALGTTGARGTLRVSNYGIFEGYGTLAGNLVLNSAFLRPGTDVVAGKQFATLKVAGNVSIENHSVIQLALDASSRLVANPRLHVTAETGVAGSTGTLDIKQDTYLTVSLAPALAADIRAAINANGGNKTSYPLYLIAASQILDDGIALASLCAISVADIGVKLFNRRSATITAEGITFDVLAGTRQIGTEDVEVIFLDNAWFGATGGLGGSTIPEPSTYALTGTFLLAGLLWLRRRRQRK